jgi:hypothetical protein
MIPASHTLTHSINYVLGNDALICNRGNVYEVQLDLKY